MIRAIVLTACLLTSSVVLARSRNDDAMAAQMCIQSCFFRGGSQVDKAYNQCIRRECESDRKSKRRRR